jgi:hypothetical protein
VLALARIALVAAFVTPVVAAELDIPDRVFEAGKIQRGTTLRHDFVVRNPGTEPLSIDAKHG